MRVAKTIVLDAQSERELRALSQRKRIEVRLQQRARIVLLAASGLQNKDIATEVGLDRRQVALWRARFLEGGIDALRKDAPRTGRPSSVMAQMESRIVQATLNERPADATHWSTRTLAELFDGRRQLMVQHFMFAPGWEQGCKSCSFMADHHAGALLHLAQRDLTLVAVSRAPLADIEAFRRRMGWTFPWVSSSGTSFNHDFGVNFSQEEMSRGAVDCFGLHRAA